jgi:hypothetical protein
MNELNKIANALGLKICAMEPEGYGLVNIDESGGSYHDTMAEVATSLAEQVRFLYDT